ncbi:MAG: hypothetical protein HYX94_03140 [Chloroflexi bacterium]|nr:hypothetical protein [Chloroflexota bacterium]
MELEAHIAAIRQETPSVKSFVLDLEGQNLPFLPGQYVDLVVETDFESLVGGFSIASSPLRKASIELAVKYRSDRRPAAHLHEKAQVGDPVLVLGSSGEFYYRPDMGSSLVLIAGGIGITPFTSMIRFVDEAKLDTRVVLLYSAKTPDELVFLDELRAISARNPRISCVFTVTRPIDESWEGRVGRIDEQLLAEIIKDSHALFYVCGPSGMAEAITALLEKQSVSAAQIRRERW